MIDKFLCRPAFEEFPAWLCPACKRSSLQFDHKLLHRWPNKGTVFGIEEGYLPRGEEDGVFSALLKCTHYPCNQGVAILGDYSSRIVDDHTYQTSVTYTIKDIYPAILLFDIAEELVPETVKLPLLRSFALYWRDPQACAVAIRATIEAIVDTLNVAREQNGRRVSLDQRLGQLANGPHAEIIEAAKAIKNIGNDGAHGDEVEREKLLASYELLEIEMRSIFNSDTARKQALIARLKTS
jgi:hypothetical protein